MNFQSTTAGVPVSSVHHPLIQEIRKAARAGRPMASGMVVSEGPHLLQEALESQWKVGHIFHTEEAGNRFEGLLRLHDAAITVLPARTLDALSTTAATQGVLALLRPRRWSWEEVVGGGSLTVVLDAIQDPGNVGTIIRSAEAFGAGGVILTEGCARSSNGKTLRAAAGSFFRIPFLEAVAPARLANDLTASSRAVYALASSGKTLLTDADLAKPCILMIGNEGAGLGPELLAVSKALRIPTERVESLNASVACSIALFEAARQRSAASFGVARQESTP